MSTSSDFRNALTALTALMDKHDYGLEDVAQRANTGTFVVCEWLHPRFPGIPFLLGRGGCQGSAVPAPHVRHEVLNALDDPSVVPNRARGWLGVPPVFSPPYGVRA